MIFTLICWCSCCWEKEVQGWGENWVRSKGGCSGVRSAVSEPGRIPRSPTLRSMGNKAAHDTGTATEESGEKTGARGGRRERRQFASSPLKNSWFTQNSVGNPTCKTTRFHITGTLQLYSSFRKAFCQITVCKLPLISFKIRWAEQTLDFSFFS